MNGGTRTTPTSLTGSILGRGVDASAINFDRMKCCFYGDNGVGKTTLLGTFPKPLVLFSFEPTRTGGVGSIANVPGITVFRRGRPEDVEVGDAEFSTTKEAVEMARELRATRGGGFATVGVESGTSLEWACLEELMAETDREMPATLLFGTVPDGMYPMRTEKAKSVLREFLDIPTHVVVTAKEKDHNPPREDRVGKNGKVQPDLRNRVARGMQKESWVAPAMGFSSMSWLLDSCQYVSRLYFDREVMEVTNPLVPGESTQIETGRFTLRMRCKQHPNFATRFQCPDPDRVPEFIENPTYEKLLSVIGG
jgi:hypothetical protein